MTLPAKLSEKWLMLGKPLLISSLVGFTFSNLMLWKAKDFCVRKSNTNEVEINDGIIS